ncbi:methyltransferase domain-containing protein [Geitlerinema sp. PCC 9228]|uniref:class I SAM-dependent methyltransferase n=1 Tax=Geitlerinema sp. PCC 9228 TaxID=111611 RepID=UPI0008F9C0A2|nr:methyltransferase domain-containing protein [Geitlerinema sp. PCC 9228]
MANEYLSKPRMISYYNQKRIINALGKKVTTILEVGVFNSLFSNILSLEGYQVTRADFDSTLNPDMILDLQSDFELPKNTFDAIVVFQVLEHIPYEDFEKAIKKLAEATNKFLVISLPYSSEYLSLNFRSSFNRDFRGVMLQIPKFWSTKPLVDDEHYWEIGLKGYPKKRIVRSLEQTGLKIRRQYQDKLQPYHYFFVLEK